MSFTNAILIATGVFVAVVIALSIIARALVGKNADRLLAIREESQALRKQHLESLQQQEKYISGLQEVVDQMKSFRQESGEVKPRDTARRERAEMSWDRWEHTQDRWEEVLSRMEAVLDISRTHVSGQTSNSGTGCEVQPSKDQE